MFERFHRTRIWIAISIIILFLILFVKKKLIGKMGNIENIISV